MQERLQKIISRAGVASRRAGEEIILAGRVRVNGHVVTELGAKADLGRDTIEVDGRRIVPEAPMYLVLHKPRGVVSTLADPEGRPTVAGLLEGAGTRLYPVGRLDFATSGVLLVTNDGDFANALLHPRGGVPKTYVLKVKGLMSDEHLERWRQGVQLDDGKTLPAEIRFLRHEEGKTWFEITLREGRNQQIRRMGEATGFPVMRLARTSFAGVTSEDLRPGKWRPLTVEELLSLREQFGVPKRIRGAASAQPRLSSGTPKRPAGRPAGERPGTTGRPTSARTGAGRPGRPRAREPKFQEPQAAPPRKPGGKAREAPVEPIARRPPRREPGRTGPRRRG
jgi:23S rRNA pseudouridine2605 synthase